MNHILQVSKAFAALLFLTLGCCIQTSAQWSTNPAVNNAICTATSNQETPAIIADGYGGTIITWVDNRNGNNDIYAQRICASGAVQWPANGVAICTASDFQLDPKIVSDGSGGAIITWHDNRNLNKDIYAQRINASGAVQWTANGVAICTNLNIQDGATMVPDGIGGAIITWEDNRNVNNDIFAQRINATGTVQWTLNGLAICTASNYQLDPAIVSDGSGGAIICWLDNRNLNNDIYAQRINVSGVAQWVTNGVAICTNLSQQGSARLVEDGLGGAIITWFDTRNVNNDIYAQLINASGLVQWTVNGVAICTASDYQLDPRIVSDGSGGAIIAWHDNRSFNKDIYAQRINASGLVQWTVNGVAICISTFNQEHQTLVEDGSGGAIITWDDFRSSSSFRDIYAQRIGASGTVQWMVNGVAIATAANNQVLPVMATDGYGGAIITWADYRNGTDFDIDAQQVNAAGALGVAQTPEINIKGNNVNIVDGDITPAAGDHTNFGNVIVGSSPSRTFTIQNLGITNLDITSITIGNALFTIGSLAPASPIPSGGSATFVVTFSPINTGVKNATITINNNDCDEGVYTFAIRGTSVSTCPTTPTIICQPVTINNTPGICTGKTLLNMPTVSGICANLSNALYFDGNDDIINTININPSVIPTMTFEAWVYRTGGINNQFIFGNDDGGSDRGLVIVNDSVHVWAGRDINTGFISTLNTWEHYMVYWSFAEVVCIKNGTQVFSTTGESPSSSVLNGSIGETIASWAFPFEGKIDEIRIWDRKVEQSELLANMNVEIDSSCGLLVSYHLNQGIAGANNAGITNVVDASGNNNDGTLINAALNGNTSNWVAGQTFNYSISNNAPCIFPLGNTTVTWIVKDASGSSSSCNQVVTVIDNQAPTLSCSANQVLNTTTCSALYTITDPVSDNCPGATWGYSLTGATQAAVSGISDGANSNPIVFLPGITVVSLHAQDASLNGAIGCTFTVTVNSSTCTQTVNLTLFLQGFYNGGSSMVPALFNQGVNSPLTTTDTITVNLISTDGTTVIASKQTTLQTNGTAVCTFFPAQYGYYYLSVKHRNSIETFSSSAMYVDASTTYDFGNTALKAYGSNQIEVENGVWALYIGDINQDGILDNNDFSIWEADAINFSTGYLASDLDGNGIVDNADFSIWEANAINFVGVIKP